MSIHHISFVLLLSTCYACQNATPEPENQSTLQHEDDLMEEAPSDSRCVYKKSDKTRETTFPFDKADKIEVVAHKTSDIYPDDSLLVNGKHLVRGISERIELDAAQTDSLFAILFDHTSAVPGAQPLPTDCMYQPRHTILFYEGKKVIALLEICLQCGDTRAVPNKYYGDFCDEKYCDLHFFFKSIGITKGLDYSAPECQWMRDQ